MDWIQPTAERVRELLAGYTWLEPLQPSIAAAPDWALLAAGPAGLLLLLVLLRAIWPKRRPRKQLHAVKPEAPVSQLPPTAATAQMAPSPQATVQTRREPKSPAPTAVTDAEPTASAVAPDQVADPEMETFQRRLQNPELRAADRAVMVAGGALVGITGETNEEVRRGEAIKSYEIAVSHDPAHSFAWSQLGGLYGQEKRYDASKHAFEKALATASSAAEEGVALWGLGLAANDRKESAVAEEFFARGAARLEGAADEVDKLVSCVKNIASLKFHRGASDAAQASQDARALARTHDLPEHELDCVHWLIGVALRGSRSAEMERPLYADIQRSAVEAGPSSPERGPPWPPQPG